MFLSKYNDENWKGQNTGGALAITERLVGQIEGPVGKFPALCLAIKFPRRHLCSSECHYCTPENPERIPKVGCTMPSKQSSKAVVQRLDTEVSWWEFIRFGHHDNGWRRYFGMFSACKVFESPIWKSLFTIYGSKIQQNSNGTKTKEKRQWQCNVNTSVTNVYYGVKINLLATGC